MEMPNTIIIQSIESNARKHRSKLQYILEELEGNKCIN